MIHGFWQAGTYERTYVITTHLPHNKAWKEYYDQASQFFGASRGGFP